MTLTTSPVAAGDLPADERTLPIVDLSAYRPAEGGPAHEQFLSQIRSAAHEFGFFYVVGHGIPSDVLDGVIDVTRRFASLPEEARQEVSNVNSPHFRGYTSVATEYTAGAPDRRDQLDFGPEREALDLGPDDPPYLRLVGPNQWPSALPALRPIVLEWIDEADRVARTVLRVLAESLGQDAGYFDRWFDSEATVSTKLVHYPATPADAPGERQGVGPHKDYGYLALVLQDDLGGLQVRAHDGSWIDATPVPEALVFNVGEALEIATRGYLKANVHQVLSPPPGQDRYSVPFFLGPRLDAVVEPITLPAGLAQEADGVDVDPDNPLFAEYGRKSLVGWIRSHPAVAERWHRDLLDVLLDAQEI